MTTRQIRVPTGLLVAMLSMLDSANALAAPGSMEARYVCANAEEFAVDRSASKASVQYEGRTYELRRKASTIGLKYIAPDAALIIDGRSAVFVADDQPLFGSCTRLTDRAER